MSDAYDEIRYPSDPIHLSHPAYIAALAKIAGCMLPPVQKWRVLEIGCGDGSNILPMAFDYPNGEFIGIDRARTAIQSGERLSARLGLCNVELLCADLLDWQPRGEFDYIIAHGVFSWVPETVRKKILKICGDALRPRGIAFISYNTLPGCYFREYVGDFLRFHVRDFDEPSKKIRGALELARSIVDKFSGEDPLLLAIRSEMETIQKKNGQVLFHDDLSEINVPFYLRDFVALAESHGLQYLGDADPQRDHAGDRTLESGNWLDSLQYDDFHAARRFRETLLCRTEVPLDRTFPYDRFRELFAASRVSPFEPGKDGRQEFGLPRKGNLTTNHPFIKAALISLASVWPESMRVSDLTIEHFKEKEIAELLMQLVRIGAVELRVHPPKIARNIRESPMASALARAQLAEGSRRVTNLSHMSVELGDEISRKVLALLDGRRDLDDIAAELLKCGLEPLSIQRNLESGLTALYRLNLLTA